MLFDLCADPHETRNLARSPERAGVVGEGLRRLDRWVGDQMSRSGRPDPLFAVLADGGPYHTRDMATFSEVLRRTGRAAHAEWLERHGGQPREA